MVNPRLEAIRRRWQRFNQAGQAQLRIHLPGQPSRLLALHDGAYSIGRDRDCQICIDHQAVSRRHGLLERRGPPLALDRSKLHQWLLVAGTARADPVASGW